MTAHKFYVAALLIVLAPFSATAHADRVILTPSASSLNIDTASAETLRGLGNHPHNFTFANFGSPLLELEVAEFNRPDRDAGALSFETQFLPETSGLPAIAFGIRDIGDNTAGYGSDGYNGRSAYIVGGRTPVQFAGAPYPFRNLTYTLGLGLGGLRGPFGSFAGDLPLNLRYTLEWDTIKFNERVALPLTPSAQLEYDRLGAANYVGVNIHTPVTLF